jgi:hypothetical protein
MKFNGADHVITFYRSFFVILCFHCIVLSLDKSIHSLHSL